jgi:hypothetical protein
MTAPERIWVGDERPVGGTIHVWNELAENARRYATEYIRADLVPDPAALVRAALEAAATQADYTGAIQDQRDGSYAGSVAVMGRDVGDIIRAIAADPDQVAAIVAKVKEQGE